MRFKPKKQTTKVDDLFSIRMGLTKTGDVKLEMDYVDPEIFKQSMEKAAPNFQDTWKVTSLMRFLKASGDRIMEKANGYLI